MDQVQALVAGGKLAAGDTLSSVRQMAADLGVNMMTVSKAYAKSEAVGVLNRSRRAVGRDRASNRSYCSRSYCSRRTDTMGPREKAA